MKLSQLRQLIKEEIRGVLNENKCPSVSDALNNAIDAFFESNPEKLAKEYTGTPARELISYLTSNPESWLENIPEDNDPYIKYREIERELYKLIPYNKFLSVVKGYQNPNNRPSITNRPPYDSNPYFGLGGGGRRPGEFKRAGAGDFPISQKPGWSKFKRRY